MTHKFAKRDGTKTQNAEICQYTQHLLAVMMWVANVLGQKRPR